MQVIIPILRKSSDLSIIVIKNVSFFCSNYSKPGQQLYNADNDDIVERARSRAASRAQDIIEESPKENHEVKGGGQQNTATNNGTYSPSRKYSVDDNIQVIQIIETIIQAP